MTTPQERFVAAARAQLGTRWVHQGRCPGVGLDCVGLAVIAAQAVPMHVKDVVAYNRIARRDSLRRAVEENCDRVFGDPELGDLILFAEGIYPQHLGICIGGGRMVHCSLDSAKVVENSYLHDYQERGRGVYRPRFTAEAE